jgi:hypothetical protein
MPIYLKYLSHINERSGSMRTDILERKAEILQWIEEE